MATWLAVKHKRVSEHEVMTDGTGKKMGIVKRLVPVAGTAFTVDFRGLWMFMALLSY